MSDPLKRIVELSYLSPLIPIDNSVNSSKWNFSNPPVPFCYPQTENSLEVKDGTPDPWDATYFA